MADGGIAGPCVLGAVREAIAAHLAVEVAEVAPDASLGFDLALDSLDVFAVLERAGALLGRTVAIDYSDSATVTKLADMRTMTVAAFVECLACG